MLILTQRLIIATLIVNGVSLLAARRLATMSTLRTEVSTFMKIYGMTRRRLLTAAGLTLVGAGDAAAFARSAQDSTPIPDASGIWSPRRSPTPRPA